MIDTVKLAAQIDELDRVYFSVEKATQTETRLDERWIVNLDSISVTYYPSSGYLYVDFDVQNFLFDPLENASQQAVDSALLRVSRRLVDHFGEQATYWVFRVQRIDYAVNTQVSDVGLYVKVLQGLQLSRHKRNIYDDTGVNWKSSMRWVKFYDKSKQIGKLGNVLRFEVSLLRRGVAQLCGQLAAAPSLKELAQVDVAVYVLMYWLRQLGCWEAVDGAAATLLHLRGVVGERELAGAWLVRECAARWGTSAYREPLSLVSQTTYYKYIHVLRANGLMMNGSLHDVSLPAVGGAVAREAKNLGLFASGLAGVNDQADLKKFSEKFSSAPDGLVIWEYLRECFAGERLHEQSVEPKAGGDPK